MAKAGDKRSPKRGRGKAPSEPLPPEDDGRPTNKFLLSPTNKFQLSPETLARFRPRFQLPQDADRIDRAVDRAVRGTAATDPPATPTAPKNPKRDKQRKSYWDDPVDRALRDNYPNSSALTFKAGKVVDKVLDALKSEIRQSGRNPPSRGLILRKSGHWRT